MKSEIIIIRADGELKKKLKEAAKKDHRSMSDFIRIQLEKITGILK